MSSVAKSSVVVGGKLKFKGSKGSSKKSAKTEEHTTKTMPTSSRDLNVETTTVRSSVDAAKSSTVFMTEAQRIHREKRMAMEEKELKKFIKTPHRDRIEMFNMRLGQMTEHNDIPRISAAGNG